MTPKFRAFWLKEKIMTNIYAIYFLEGGIKVEDGCCYSEFVKDGNVVLMQSTGLHDKHGVEIFEGDILTSQDGTDGLISRFIVKRDEFYTGFTPMNREGCGFNRAMCEVIGNVHQHPELLDGV